MNLLSLDELEALTGRRLPSAQMRELKHLGIPFERRRDGSLLVAEAAVMAVLAPAATAAPEPARVVPDFGALSRPRK